MPNENIVIRTHNNASVRAKDMRMARYRTRSGQALIEVCVCMIGIVVVLIAMLELTKICMLHTVTMMEARADVAAVMQHDTVLFPTPQFLQTWDEGPDGKRYTADDVPVTASSASFYNTTVQRSVADPSDWDILSQTPNRLVTLHNSPMMLAACFGLLRGSASETTDLLPGFQRFIYRESSLTIESEVWMTWTKGMY